MAATREQLIGKCVGMLQPYNKMTAKEKEANPSVSYCKNYNELRRLALEYLPNHAEVMPPAIEIVETEQFGKGCIERMSEIVSYVSEIHQQIARFDPPSSLGRVERG